MATNKTKETALADFSEFDGDGFGNVDASHLKIPFLSLLQDMSDEVKPKHENYINGAKPGMFMNSVTKEIYGENVNFVPAEVDHCFVEWVPRKRGGGFVGRHEKTSPTVKQARLDNPGTLQLKVARTDDEGNTFNNDLVETFYIAGVVMTDNGPQPIIVAATSTKIGPYKDWMTRLNMFTIPKPGGGKQRPPLFAHQVTISSWGDSNAKGDFSNIKIQHKVDNDIAKSLITDLNSDTFLEGKNVRALLTSGNASMDYDSQNAGTGTATPKNDDDF